MLTQPIKKSFLLEDGREITLETGQLAQQADGAVVLRLGNTMLLATAVAETASSEHLGFFPLSVDYQEKFAAAGKIPGGFLRREGRPGDHEILTCRLVDRAIRPLFPKDYYCAVQIQIYLLSSDPNVPPDALAALAASAALSVSSIPFAGPISEVRVARVDGELCINPTTAALAKADMDLMVGATADHVLMVEGEMNEVSEEEMLSAIEYAHAAIKQQCEAQLALAEAVGATEKRTYNAQKDTEMREQVFSALYDKVYAVAKQGIKDKKQRNAAFAEIKTQFVEGLPEETDTSHVGKYFHELQKQAMHDLLLKEKLRVDGRKPTEIRSITTEVDYLPAAHGSALFTRGETQALATATLGGKMDEQLIDSVMVSGYNKFMLHYSFPGFCTGEVKPNRGVSRREVGHGNLALRALKKVLPNEAENPYTIRIDSTILGSNGSSSMGTVCSGSLALMDAGLPITNPVSGIAMGLSIDPGTNEYVVLSDILGDEDFFGDMDFKVAGTKDGITACQMDIKVGGLSHKILQEALAQAREGRLHILQEMTQSLAAPRAELKPHIPRVSITRIPKETIGALIGPGGKIIQELQAKTNTTITVEEEGNEGVVKVASANKENLVEAERLVKLVTLGPTVGDTYLGKVKAILDYGAFVEFFPGRDGLLHISEVKWERIEDLKDVLEVGEEIQVKLVDIDAKTGKFRLSRKALLPREVVAE